MLKEKKLQKNTDDKAKMLMVRHNSNENNDILLNIDKI